MKPNSGEARPSQEPRKGRVSSAWVFAAVLVILGIAFVDFLAENTRPVELDFFSVSGNIPAIVALIAAAVVGAVLVLAVGIARMTQLRLSLRRMKATPNRTDPVAANLQPGTSSETTDSRLQ